jgi:hypothetical protein
MRYLALLLLLSCRMPDSVGVGANASQYDYLGFNQNTLLTNDVGMGYGVGVWAEWQLSNQPQPITWEWPQSPPYYLASKDSPVIVNSPAVSTSTASSASDDHVERGVSAVKALDSTQASTQIIVLILGLAAVGAIIFLKSRKPK